MSDNSCSQLTSYPLPWKCCLKRPAQLLAKWSVFFWRRDDVTSLIWIASKERFHHVLFMLILLVGVASSLFSTLGFPGCVKHRAMTSKSISNRWCFTLKFSALGLREGVVSWFSVWTVKSPWPSVKSPQGKSTDLCCRSFRPIPLSVYMHSHFISALIIYLAANNLKSPDRSDLSHGLCWSSAGELSTRNFFTVDGEEKWTIHLTLNLKSLPI